MRGALYGEPYQYQKDISGVCRRKVFVPFSVWKPGAGGNAVPLLKLLRCCILCRLSAYPALRLLHNTITLREYPQPSKGTLSRAEMPFHQSNTILPPDNSPFFCGLQFKVVYFLYDFIYHAGIFLCYFVHFPNGVIDVVNVIGHFVHFQRDCFRQVI